VSGLRLYAVVLVDGGEDKLVAPDASVIMFRDLGAIVRPAPFEATGGDPDDVERTAQLVSRLFRRTPVLPAPFGAVVKSAEQVKRWLEMNYIALSEGLHYVEGRCETRVHITPNPAVRPVDGKVEILTTGSECFRDLRRHAVAAMITRQEAEAMTEAFLIPEDAWDEFAERVRSHAFRHEALTFRQTGPWPPYDFVRIDFDG
jgi:hypothetical protein